MVSLSYLHLRPAILEQLKRELPPTEFGVLRSYFESQPWTVVGASTRSKLIPLSLREKGYKRFMALAKEFGITTLICLFKNPDMPANQCFTGMRAEQPSGGRSRQLSLFSC